MLQKLNAFDTSVNEFFDIDIFIDFFISFTILVMGAMKTYRTGFTKMKTFLAGFFPFKHLTHNVSENAKGI